MTTPSSREDVQALNHQMIEEFYAGDSVTVIARNYGRDPTTVRRLIKLDKLANGERERTAKPRDPRIMLDKRILSPRHGHLGSVVSAYRARHDLTPTAFGMLIRVSRVQVRNMELGDHDFTLGEVDRLSKVLNIPFEALVAGYPAIVVKTPYNETGGRIAS